MVANAVLVTAQAGIVAMAVVDAVLVFGGQRQGPNAVLNAAAPAEDLPQLQYLDLHFASMGYGDVFVAGVLGGVAWDALFLAVETLPATVPVAAGLLTAEAWRSSLRAQVPIT